MACVLMFLAVVLIVGLVIVSAFLHDGPRAVNWAMLIVYIPFVLLGLLAIIFN